MYEGINTIYNADVTYPSLPNPVISPDNIPVQKDRWWNVRMSIQASERPVGYTKTQEVPS